MTSAKRTAKTGRDSFDTTDWHTIVEASKHKDHQSRKALAELAEAYWQPLYAYTRQLGKSPESAQDMTQEFFAHMMEKDFLAKASPLRGRFRNFLLTTYKRFLSDERDKRQAKKRGGGIPHIRFDYNSAETTWRLAPGHSEHPEKVYERQWARTLLGRALDVLRSEFAEAQNAAIFNSLEGYLTTEHAGVPYKTLAEQLGITPGALRVMVHRLRKRYRALLEEEIKKTTGPGADVAAEVRDLYRMLSR